jgi:uncharacterized OsmC-like protein
MTQDAVRSYAVQARSTDVHGRVLCNVRNHHFVVDGPVQNGCPGEEVTPAEMFLAAIAACGVELVQSFAKAQQLALRTVHVAISGALDRSRPVRTDLTVLNRVKVEFALAGVSAAEADDLIGKFRNR